MLVGFFARKPLSSGTIVLTLAFGTGGYAVLFGFVQSYLLAGDATSVGSLA